MGRDRFEVNEEDRDSRWLSMEIREGVVDNGEDSEGNGNGDPWEIALEGSTLARERSLAPSNSSGTVAAFMDLDTVVSTSLSSVPCISALRLRVNRFRPPWGLSHPRLIVIYLCPR